MGVFPERKKRERGASQEGAIHTLQTENENETANNGRGKEKDREFAEQDDAYMLEARKEWDKKRNLSNILGSMGGRNSRIRSFLKDGGGGLLRILLDNYPGKATEVFKYLKLAGYEEGEMMELVDREEGKTEETEFLYQSPLGRKFLKEKKQKK